MHLIHWIDLPVAQLCRTGCSNCGIGPDLRMAVHAGLGRRNARVARLLHRGVAVLALQSQALHVVLVAERNRLVRPLPLPRHPRRALQLVQRSPSAMTISPVNTRLARASAFELRSKICAMSAFLRLLVAVKR